MGDADLDRVCDETGFALELCSSGNYRSTIRAVERLRSRGRLDPALALAFPYLASWRSTAFPNRNHRMNAIDKALATQLGNIETRTGKTLEELNTIIRKSGLEKHGQIRDMLKKELGMGHGDANTLVHLYLNPPSAAPASDDGLRQIAGRLDAILGELQRRPLRGS